MNQHTVSAFIEACQVGFTNTLFLPHNPKQSEVVTDLLLGSPATQVALQSPGFLIAP